MKKLTSVILLLIILCIFCCAAIAEETTSSFDKSKITGSSLYNYDKFSKEWNIQGAYYKEYRDAYVKVVLLLFDAYVEWECGPELRIIFFDKEQNCYDEVTAFRAIVGEKMFSFEKPTVDDNSSSVYSCDTLEAFCNALIDGTEVAFQLDHTDMYGKSWTATIDPVASSDLTELVGMAQLLKNSNAWTISSYGSLSDILYEASIE